tara:strand:+ start:14203 stop:14433 length:231 start_codon:yes stop_codon:yes gene_type:complete
MRPQHHRDFTAEASSGLNQKVLIALLGYPMGAKEMAVTNTAGALWFFIGVDSKEEQRDFRKRCAVGFGIEQASVKL